ncbi:MAG: YjfB family protein [Spirochaetes bacterium]|nr:YjfB family protein [Spirochaetota bacterium]
MEISNINSSYLSRNITGIQEMFGLGMLKKAMSNQENLMALLLKSLPDPEIGQNIDITV